MHKSNPTMEENSSRPGPKDAEKNSALFQQFTNLEKQWESLRESNSKQRSSTTTATTTSSGISRRSSTGSNSALLNSFQRLHVVECSPRGLMSSLQHRRSPSDGFLNAKNWDVSVEEIVRDRRSAIRTGKVKGRRLFGDGEGEEEVELEYEDGGCGESEVCNDWSDLNPGKSCSISDALVNEVVVEKKVVEVVETRFEGRKPRGGGRTFKVAVAWSALLIVLVTLGLVVLSCRGNAHEFEVFLVPT